MTALHRAPPPAQEEWIPLAKETLGASLGSVKVGPPRPYPRVCFIPGFFAQSPPLPPEINKQISKQINQRK